MPRMTNRPGWLTARNGVYEWWGDLDPHEQDAACNLMGEVIRLLYAIEREIEAANAKRKAKGQRQAKAQETKRSRKAKKSSQVARREG